MTFFCDISFLPLGLKFYFLKKERKEESFIKKPFYKEGAKAFNDFIYSNLKYPQEAVKNKIEGIIICKYDIDHEGNVIDVKVVKGLGYGCDEEAVRVIKKLKFEVPKNPRGMRIIFHKDIKIQFKMQVQKVEEPKQNLLQPLAPIVQTKIQYTITPTVPKSNPSQKPLTQKPQPNTYQYTIKL
jgi:TonB family protein